MYVRLIRLRRGIDSESMRDKVTDEWAQEKGGNDDFAILPIVDKKACFP